MFSNNIKHNNILCILTVCLFAFASLFGTSNAVRAESSQISSELLEMESVQEAAEDTKDAEAVEEANADPISTNNIEGWPKKNSIASDYACLMDADTGLVLCNKDMDVSTPPASLTKLMTGLLAVESGRLDDEVTVDGYATAYVFPGSSNISLQMGEVLTLRELLYGTLLESANDCATAVGVYLGDGSIDTFAEMMNTRAEELGCTGSHFVNACGMPADGHVSTAHDLARISQAALQNDTFREIVGTAQYTLRATNLSAERTLKNHHPFFTNPADYPCVGFLGGKTGYTDAAGNCLTSFVERDGMTLIAVSLHASDLGGAISDNLRLIDYGYTNFQKVTFDSGSEILLEDGTLLENGTVLEGGTFILPKEASLADCQTDEEALDNGDGTLTVKRAYSWNGYALGSVTFAGSIVVMEEASSTAEDGADLERAEESQETEGALDTASAESVPADSNRSSAGRAIFSEEDADAFGQITVFGHSMSKMALVTVLVLFVLIFIGVILIIVFVSRKRKKKLISEGKRKKKDKQL